MNTVIDGITAVKTDAADISIYGKSINEITSDDIAEMFPGLDNDNSPDSISYTLQDYSNDTIFFRVTFKDGYLNLIYRNN